MYLEGGAYAGEHERWEQSWEMRLLDGQKVLSGPEQRELVGGFLSSES